MRLSTAQALHLALDAPPLAFQPIEQDFLLPVEQR